MDNDADALHAAFCYARAENDPQATVHTPHERWKLHKKESTMTTV
jgi:hypothetical protein